MSEREPKLLIEDIIESADRIFLYTSGMTFEVFFSVNKTISNLITRLGISWCFYYLYESKIIRSYGRCGSGSAPLTMTVLALGSARACK